MMAPKTTECDGPMTILFDLVHPCYYLFFRRTIMELRAQGHRVLIASREKDVLLPLLDADGLEHRMLSRQKGKGVLALACEGAVRLWRLWRMARRHRPDLAIGFGGTFAGLLSLLTGTKSLVFYDTDHAELENRVAAFGASHVCVPVWFKGYVPAHKTHRYHALKEMAWLHPARFNPDRALAEAAGLHPEKPTVLLRLISWQASHDRGQGGWPDALLEELAVRLTADYHLVISSERELPSALARRRYAGKPEQMHHLMAFCAGYLGESPTMAAECAVLGVPALHASPLQVAYVTYAEQQGAAVRAFSCFTAESLYEAFCALRAEPEKIRRERHAAFLAAQDDPHAFIMAQIRELSSETL